MKEPHTAGQEQEVLFILPTAKIDDMVTVILSRTALTRSHEQHGGCRGELRSWWEWSNSTRGQVRRHILRASLMPWLGESLLSSKFSMF